MAQRDQLAGALGRLDAGDARDAEHVALGRVAGRHALGVAGVMRTTARATARRA